MTALHAVAINTAVSSANVETNSFWLAKEQKQANAVYKRICSSYGLSFKIFKICLVLIKQI